MPTVAPDPADAEPAPAGDEGGGDISPIFSLLSIAGFATAGGILVRQWRATRPDIRDQNPGSG